MRFAGRVYKDGKHWLAEIPILDAMTQGRTRREALEMAADLVETLVNREGFKASVHVRDAGEFELGSTDTTALVSLLLRRQRQASGLSLSQVAQRLGARSRNSYARYEQGKSVPTLEKLNRLLHAVSSGRDFVLIESRAA